MAFMRFSSRSSLGLLALAASAVALLPAPAAQAQTVSYTDQSAFLAAIQTGYYSENFTGQNGNAPSYSYSGNGYGYTISVPASSVPALAVYRDGQVIGNGLAGEQLLITFTGGNVTAVGGNFFISDVGSAFQSEPVTITLSDGTTTTYTPAGTNTFQGYTSATSITSLLLAAPPGGSTASTARYNNIDNLIVGTAVPTTPTAVTPEASPFVNLCGALLGPGVLGMVAVRKQRRKAKAKA